MSSEYKPTEKRRDIDDLYQELKDHHPELIEQIDDALILALSQNMTVKIYLRTCSSYSDDYEIKQFKHNGRYLDCSIYPVSGVLKLPPKEKPQPAKPVQQQQPTQDKMDQEPFIAPQEYKNTQLPKVYQPRLIVDGNHKFVISDLLDTFNVPKEDFARKRISKMKQIKEKIGSDDVPMLYKLMARAFKVIIETINKTVMLKEECDRLRDEIITENKKANQNYDPSKIDWSKMTMDQVNDKNPDAKYYKLFPGWYTESLKNPNFRPEIDCHLNFYCNEGVYESIACGLIFFDMLRFFNLDSYLVKGPKSNDRKYPSSLDLFQENSGYYDGKRIWNGKRTVYLKKKEEEKKRMAQEAQNEADGTMSLMIEGGGAEGNEMGMMTDGEPMNVLD